MSAVPVGKRMADRRASRVGSHAVFILKAQLNPESFQEEVKHSVFVDFYAVGGVQVLNKKDHCTQELRSGRKLGAVQG